MLLRAMINPKSIACGRGWFSSRAMIVTITDVNIIWSPPPIIASLPMFLNYANESSRPIVKRSITTPICARSSTVPISVINLRPCGPIIMPVVRKLTIVGMPSRWKIRMIGMDAPINIIISLSKGISSI